MTAPLTAEKETSSGPRALIAKALHRMARTVRDDRVVNGVSALAPPTDSLLDIGCSDGRIARRLATTLGAREVQGADVELHADASIPVAVYDGRRLPFDDAHFGVVTLIDVLHHAEEPASVMREALRVLRPGGAVIVKDHLRLGRWSNFVLSAMDRTSNFGEHALTAGRYLSPAQWPNLVADAGGRIDHMEWPFRVHDLPWRLVASSRYQLLLRVVPA